MLKLLLVSVFFMSFSTASAQNPLSDFYKKIKNAREDKFANEEVFRTRHVGFIFQDVQNTVFSPLTYIGGGMAFTNTKTKIYNSKIKTRTFQASVASLNGFAAKSPFVSTSIDLTFEKKYIRSKHLSWGYSTNIFTKGRLGPNFQNNAVQSESGINVGPTLNYNFELLDFVHTELDFSVAALGLSSFTPLYANSLDAFEIKFTSIHNSLFPKASIFFDVLKSKRYPNKKYRIGYQWQMAHVRRDFGNRYTLATHNFVLIGNLTKLK